MLWHVKPKQDACLRVRSPNKGQTHRQRRSQRCCARNRRCERAYRMADGKGRVAGRLFVRGRPRLSGASLCGNACPLEVSMWVTASSSASQIRLASGPWPVQYTAFRSRSSNERGNVMVTRCFRDLDGRELTSPEPLTVLGKDVSSVESIVAS